MSAGLNDEDAAFMRAIGKKIRILRLTREWTQEELADRSGISRNFVSVIERGKAEGTASVFGGIDILRLRHVAVALDVPLCDLLPEESRRE